MSDGAADGAGPTGSGPAGSDASGPVGAAGGESQPHFGHEDADDLPATVDEESTAVEVERDSVPPAEAFGALGNEVRTSVLRRLGEAAEAGETPLSFSELLDASPAEESAGFAYHLRQLTDRFCRKSEDGYELTAAGRRMARALRAGTYTDRVSFGPVALDDPCPFCDGGLRARGVDGDVAVGCADCGRPVLRLPLPPRGADDRSPAAAVSALDDHHRRRLSAMADGACPDCGGVVDRTLDRAGDGLAGEALPGESVAETTDSVAGRVRASMRCRGCGASLASPVTLTVLDRPPVVAFYHRHGEDPRDRPIWNVGSEWRETVVSAEPWLVKVSARLDGEELSLYVDGELEVVGSEQAAS